jgi:hypothetical protein
MSHFLKKNPGAGGVPFQGHRRPNPAGARLGLGLLKNTGKRSAFSSQLSAKTKSYVNLMKNGRLCPLAYLLEFVH